MTDDLREHPVVDLLRRRRAEGSRPGEREDGARIALAIEGGAMRGVVSAGMASALEQLGLRDCFDEVHGSSAGAFNAAFFIAGQAAYITALYLHGFGDPRFISARRALRGGALFDMDYVIGEVWRRQRPLRTRALLESGVELHCTATDVDTATIIDLSDLRDAEEIRCALRASGRLPWLAGQPVTFRGQRLLDATLAEAIPVQAALQRCTHVLVLQTRPHGIQHTPLSPIVTRLTDRYLLPLNPALGQLLRTRSERYDRLSDELGARHAAPDASPAVCVIRPPAGARPMGQLEHRSSVMQRAASEGLRAAWMAIEGEDPELLAVLRAFPAAGAAGRETETARSMDFDAADQRV